MKAANKAEKLWYAIRAIPGTQRTAKATDGASSLMESILERNLRNEGIPVFMPTIHFEMRHHRTKRWVERRYPLLTGYAFVELSNHTFEQVREVEGVMCFIRQSAMSGPYRMSNAEIESLRSVEEDNRSIILKRRAEREARERREMNQTTRKERDAFFPTGTEAMICGRNPFSGLVARVIGPSSRGTVKTIVQTLENMIEVDIPLEHLEAVA